MNVRVQLLCLLLVQQLSISESAAAAVKSYGSSFGIEFGAEAFREYDLLELARLVYKAEPEVVRETLGTILEEEEEEEAGAERSLIYDVISSMEVELYEEEEEGLDGCMVCENLVGLLKPISLSPALSSQLTETLIRICLNISVPLGIRGEVLCPGALNLQMPHVYAVLSKRDNTAARVCEFLNLCLPATPAAMEDKALRSAVERLSGDSEEGEEPRGRARGRGSEASPPENSLVVIQLTDIHFEPRYTIGTNTNCGLPVCCVPDYGPGYAGQYGDYKCNIPRTTAELFVQKANSLNPDVVLFSGDVPPHSVWEETVESQKDCSEILVDVLNKSMPGRRVYPNIGNHEGYPTNLFSIGSMPSYTPGFLDWYADLWQHLAEFSASDTENIIKGGYYSKLVSEGLRLISFNTNYMYTFNWYNTDNHRDTVLQDSEYTTMTKFVEAELEEARVNNEKVILMGHHPPGGSDYIVKGSRWHRALVLEYSDIIILQPSGHTHYDEIRMIYDDDGVPRSVVLVAPSMSTGGTRNPSMRVFYLDRDTKELLDYDHFYLDIGPVLHKQEDVPHDWSELITLLYSAREEYDLPDLSPASWDNLLDRFETDSVLLNKHRAHSQADADKSLGICLERCQTNHICRQRHINYDEYKNCTITLSEIDWESILNPTRPTLPPNPPISTAPHPHSSSYLPTLIILIISSLLSIHT